MWDLRGKVEVKTSNATVTGDGTDFSAVSRVGDAFVGPDGRMYEITEISSPTTLTIDPPYKGSNVTGSYCIIPVRYYHPEIVDRVFEIIGTVEKIGEVPSWVRNFSKSAMVTAVSDTSSGIPRANSSGKLADSLVPSNIVKKVSGSIPNALIPSKVFRGTVTADYLTESFKTELVQEFTG